MKIHHRLPTITRKEDWVAIDIEMFQLEPYKFHIPGTGKFACMSICTNGEDVYMITDPEDVEDALYNVRFSMWVMHNAPFDIAHLRELAFIPSREKKLWDTMYIDRILWGGFFDRFSLASLARRYLDIYLEKETRDLFEEGEELTADMIKYSAFDAKCTWHIAQKQRDRISDRVLNEVWWKTDSPAMWALMDAKGFRIDVDAWEALAERNKERQLEIDEQLPFNPRSYAQVRKHLKECGFPNLPSTGKKILDKFISKFPGTEAERLARMTLLSRKYSKRVTTYGKNYFKKYLLEENDYHVVKSAWRVIGAETGRTSSRDPNLQNIPVRDTIEFRQCFVARPGNKLIVADYSQQEPRISAFVSKDKRLKKVFNSGGDIYQNIAEMRWKEKVSRDDPRRRKIKDVVLGTGYGLTEYGLSEQWDCSVEEAEEFLYEFWELFPRWQTYMDRMRQKKVSVSTVIGRKIWLNRYSNQCERNALNAPIQGSGADMMKRAIAEIWNGWDHGSWALVGTVHDEIIFDVPEKDVMDVSLLIEHRMVKVAEEMCPGIDFKVDIHVCDTWAEAKE